jgi:hypothetical protein
MGNTHSGKPRKYVNMFQNVQSMSVPGYQRSVKTKSRIDVGPTKQHQPTQQPNIKHQTPG